MKKLFVALLTAPVVSGGMAACSTEPDPSQSLVGTWDCIGLVDGGVPQGCSGTFAFGADGSISIQGTFSGTPISVIGTYVQTETTVVIDAGGDVTTFVLSFSGDVATLTQENPPPASSVTFTLRRR